MKSTGSQKPSPAHEAAQEKEPIETPGMPKRDEAPEERVEQDETTPMQEAEASQPDQAVDPLAEAQAQIDQLLDQQARTQAEYENFRKRTQREKELLFEDALADVVTRWLPLVDNLDRGILAAQAVSSEGEVLEGLRMIRRQADEILNKLEVEVIPALGETFDPNLHHAVLQIEDESKGEQEIVEVFEPGYRRGARVLRHAVVKVAN